MSIAAYVAWRKHADATGQLKIDVERHMRQPDLHSAVDAVCHLAGIPTAQTHCVTIYRDSAVIEYYERNNDGKFYVIDNEVASSVKSIPLLPDRTQ